MLWHLSWKMAPLGTQRRSSRCLLRSPISVAFANNLLSLPGPQRAPRGSEACSGGSRALSDDYVGPKGTSLLKGAPVLRWVEAGWGMEPMSGTSCATKASTTTPSQLEETCLFPVDIVHTSPFPLRWITSAGARSKGLLKSQAGPASVQARTSPKRGVTNWGMLLPLPAGW